MSEADENESGQIGLKGKNIFKGYYKNKKATNDCMHDGFFLTGDIGYKDQNGKFYFSDRSKDLIIKGGVNIFPGEIEEVIYEMQGIRLVAVVGKKHHLYGEDITAFIQKEEDSNINETDVMDHCNRFLQRMKIPSEIVFIEEMPQTASGKILKRNLK